MKQLSVLAAAAYMAADKGGKGGKQSGNRDQEREDTNRRGETGRKGDEKSGQGRSTTPETGRKGSEKDQDSGRGKGNSGNNR